MKSAALEKRSHSGANNAARRSRSRWSADFSPLGSPNSPNLGVFWAAIEFRTVRRTKVRASIVPFCVLLWLFILCTTRATDISLGSVAVLPGGSAQMPLVVSQAAPGISAFAIWLANPPGFATPSVTPGPAQPNLTVFIDAQPSGLLRLTGVILAGPAVTNGQIATLHFNAPPSLSPGAYPVPLGALVAPNPELRALITSDLLPASGAGGFIYVPNSPRLTTLTRSGSTFHFSFDGTNGIAYSVQASTNLINWTLIGPATQISPGLFQFTDPDANLYPHRFYKVRVP